MNLMKIELATIQDVPALLDLNLMFKRIVYEA